MGQGASCNVSGPHYAPGLTCALVGDVWSDTPDSPSANHCIPIYDVLILALHLING